jgi:hypothetical protein
MIKPAKAVTTLLRRGLACRHVRRCRGVDERVKQSTSLILWSWRRELNPRPSDYKSSIYKGSTSYPEYH